MKVIEIDVMYRDACNYKNSDSFYFSNKEKLSLNNIINIFEKSDIMNEGIMVEDYGIPSIAPMSNEFLMSYESDNHPYCEIVGVDEIDYIGQHIQEPDIEEVMLVVKNGPTEVNKLERLDYAIEEMENYLKTLKKMRKEGK